MKLSSSKGNIVNVKEIGRDDLTVKPATIVQERNLVILKVLRLISEIQRQFSCHLQSINFNLRNCTVVIFPYTFFYTIPIILTHHYLLLFLTLLYTPGSFI